MPFEYLEDIATADVAFRAWGKTPEEMFASAAEATVSVMIQDIGSVQEKIKRPVLLVSDSLDMLLFQYLQEIIFFKDAQTLILKPAEIRIQPAVNGFQLRGEWQGESLDAARHKPQVDVKAVTLHRFAVCQKNDRWEATVVLDI